MTKRISAAHAKAQLASVVDEVLHGSERYVIERRGRPVAGIVSIEDLRRIEDSGALSERPAGALALVGAWSELEDAEIDAFVNDILKERARDVGREIRIET
ncbi:MAG TPA: type II toxin-antitoxin system Phd/YefM family antitoxin [Tepidiformaceae bacterium]|nr:type II toxin-antitoxin system Phd/YefM family antitoxin [Tepidiformaceae bacterium]